MNEYSRIIIEEACMARKSKKAERLLNLVQLSYDVESETIYADAVFLEKAINTEKKPEVQDALCELYEFFFGFNPKDAIY